MQKSIRIWRTLLSCVLIVGALLQGFTFAPVTAQADEGEQDFGIYLSRNTFNPLEALPELPQSLTFTPAEVAANGVYLVQFNGPIEDAWKENVVQAGGQIGPYIPNYSFIVKLDTEALARVRSLPEVRWVGPYQAAYKLAEQVTPTDTRTYRVLLAPWAEAERNAQAMSAFAVRPVQNHAQPVEETQAVAGGPVEKILAADLDGAGLEQAARMGDVLWIEPLYLNKLHNNIGGAIMGGGVAWSNGYTGTGQVINVTDTGLDTGNKTTVHQDFRTHTANIASWPVVAADYGDGCVIQNPGANDGPSDKDGHGTHVTGSVAGNGTASTGQIKGLAYTSTINFQAINQFTDFPSGCQIGDGEYLTGIPVNMAPMFQQAYNWGARVQNESWGGGIFGDYDDQARQFDSFINSYQDFAVFVAAGNAGTDNGYSGDGYVDLNSISSPATAKNVITIGASENERATGGLQDPWWLLWDDFYWGPTGDDYPSDSRQHVAAFSSRGPMADGRIKPDLVAPGTNILSTRSSLETGGGWGPYNSYYHYMGGTSMASPLSAGAGALVRQYYVTREKVAAPSAALVKATLINTATDITGYGNAAYEAGQPIPNMHEGWGLINVGAATTPGRKFVDNTTGLTTGATHTYTYTVAAGKPLKVSLVWSDKPASASAAITLVNNLSLRVTAPNGTAAYLGNVFSNGWSVPGGSIDSRNNVENVYIAAPTPGNWKVEVIGHNVPLGPQRYALVVGGNVSTPAVLPAAFNKTAPAHGATGVPTTAALTWAASAGATRYEACIDTSVNNTCNASWLNMGNTTAWKPGFAPGVTYSWQVRAVNASGVREASGGWWTFTTASAALPGAFAKTSPSHGVTGVPTTAALTWAASAGATRYEACIDTSVNNTCNASWLNMGNTTAWKPGFAPGVTYSWQVRAVNASGVREASGGWWTFTTAGALPGAFNKTSPAHGVTGVPTTASLTWAASAGATRYEVCIDTSVNNTCNASWLNMGNVTTWKPGFAAGVTYSWQVRAVNGSGVREASGGWWTFTTAGALPGAFSKIYPGHGYAGVPTNGSLSWGVSSGATRYEVCIDTSVNNTCNGTWFNMGNTTTWKPGFAPGVIYSWQVRAVNGSGVRDASGGWWTFTTAAAP